MEVVILAAGKGSRMNSSTPKVLHSIGGKAMLAHVVDAATALACEQIHVVVGFGADEIKAYCNASSDLADLNFVVQEEQLGTGHAVQQAMPALKSSDDENIVLVLYGDVPLIQPHTLQELVAATDSSTISLLTAGTSNPTGLGRIIRNSKGEVAAIVEEKDATSEQLQINEINTGIMAIPAAKLKQWLNDLGNDNEQKEYYLTDVIAMAVSDGCRVNAQVLEDEIEAQGVNDKFQLALLERYYQSRVSGYLLQSGVTLRDPNRFDMRGHASFGKDVEVDINVILEGTCTIGDKVQLGANVLIKDTEIGNNVTILPGSHLDGAVIADDCIIGPNARIRPGTKLGEGVKIGNFVETKNAVFGKGSKANHLAYVGDAVIGSGVNIGAGTIFCNYDGVNKHTSTLGDNVFIGSNSVLIAPVVLENNSFVAAGSAINVKVKENQLAVGRAKQRNVDGWKRPQKK